MRPRHRRKKEYPAQYRACVDKMRDNVKRRYEMGDKGKKDKDKSRNQKIRKKEQKAKKKQDKQKSTTL